MFKPHTIKLEFKLTDLWPISPEFITDELEFYNPYYNNMSRLDTPLTIL
jgi:hypothetical protein